MEKFVYTGEEHNKVEKLKSMSDTRFGNLYDKWSAEDDNAERKKIIEIVVSKIVNGLKNYDKDKQQQPAVLQGAFDDLILSGFKEYDIREKILPKLLKNQDFVSIYRSFGRRGNEPQINEDILGRIKGAVSFKELYESEKKEDDFWGTNITIDAFHKVDAVRTRPDNVIEIIQSKSSLKTQTNSSKESPEEIHNHHQKYIDEFFGFIIKNKEIEREIEEKIEEKRQEIIDRLEDERNEESRNILLDIFEKILSDKCTKKFVLDKIKKIDLDLESFVSIYYTSDEEGIREFTEGIGVYPSEAEKIIKYIRNNLMSDKEKENLSKNIAPTTILEKFKGDLYSVIAVSGKVVSRKKIVVRSDIDILDN